MAREAMQKAKQKIRSPWISPKNTSAEAEAADLRFEARPPPAATPLSLLQFMPGRTMMAVVWAGRTAGRAAGLKRNPRASSSFRGVSPVRAALFF